MNIFERAGVILNTITSPERLREHGEREFRRTRQTVNRGDIYGTAYHAVQYTMSRFLAEEFDSIRSARRGEFRNAVRHYGRGLREGLNAVVVPFGAMLDASAQQARKLRD